MIKNMRHMLRGMSSVIALTLSVAAFSGGQVNALEPQYDIWIGETKITESNKDNVLAGDPVNDGKVRYDSKTNTLYLDDAVLTGGHQFAILGNPKDMREVAIFSEESQLYIEGSAKISDVDVGIWAYDLDYTTNEMEGDLDIEASVLGIEAQSANIYDVDIDISITNPEMSIGITAMGDLYFDGTDLTVDGAFFGVMSNYKGVHFVGTETPNVKITTSGSCVRASYVDFFNGSIELNQTGDANIFNNYQPCAVYAEEVSGESGNARVKINSNTNGIYADKELRIGMGDFRIKAEGFGLASDDRLSINKSFCTTSVEIDAGTAILGNSLSIDQDQVKAPKESSLGTDFDTGYEVLTDKDGKNATYVVINGFDLSYVEEKPATLTEEGCKAYYQSGSAGDNKIFADELGLYEITDKDSLIIPKLVAMPDVTGMNYEEAKTKLEGFLKDNNIDATINVGWGPNSDPAKNLLVSQSTPAAGTGIGSSTKEITIMVYEGYNPPANDDKTPTNNETSNNDTNKDEPNAKISSFVDRLYKLVLGRDADEEGKKYWVNELSSFDKSGASVAQGFMFSDEFINGNSTDEQFVNTLYNTFFDREADADGLKYWLGQLSDKKMTRYDVANGFIFSQEWADTCAAYGILSGTNVKPSVEIKPTELTYSFVERLYKTALNREFDNDGREYWAAKLANFDLTGEQVGVEFFLSAEMKDKGLSNEEFVNRLYLTFMNREPDADGKAYWIGVLDKGADRSSVVYGFTRSAEFTDKCVEARILPC